MRRTVRQTILTPADVERVFRALGIEPREVDKQMVLHLGSTAGVVRDYLVDHWRMSPRPVDWVIGQVIKLRTMYKEEDI